MEISFIIPVYRHDNHLDMCLLSILGQVTLPDVEVVCVPVAEGEIEGEPLLMQWPERDRKVVIAEKATNLFYALHKGLQSAQGDYLFFMPQTSMLTAIDNVKEAVQMAKKNGLQMLLTAKNQRKDYDAFAPTELFSPRKDLLPDDAFVKPFSARLADINLYWADIPTVYGNLYHRDYLLSLFPKAVSFGNTGDLIIAMTALIHAESICCTEIPLLTNRYEDSVHPLLTSTELLTAERILTIQLANAIKEGAPNVVARNITLFYLAHTISSFHPYSTFKKVAEHYRELCRYFANPLNTEISPYIYRALLYLQEIAKYESDSDALIETYSKPSRGLVFTKYSTLCSTSK